MSDLKSATLFGAILEFIVGFAKYIFAFIALILILSYFILKNVVAFPVTQHFGTDQYLQNILHFHTDDYGFITAKVELYDKIINIKERASSDHLVLHSGNMFRFKGYMEKENVRWIAAMVYKDQKPYYGYFVVPKESNKMNNQYYHLNSNFPWADLTNKRDESYIEDLTKSKIRIMTARGGLKMQEIRESQKYLVLVAWEDSLYYCEDKYAPLVSTITKKYYSNSKKEDDIFLDISHRWGFH
jgi:hypothetical protein